MFSSGDRCRTLSGTSDPILLMIMTNPLPHCPAWTLHAWPPLLWQVGRYIPLRLRHLGTQVTNPGDAMFRSVGQTLWAWHGEEGDVGMAWDWVQLGRGVVAMADPMAVVTNLRLVGEEGEVLGPVESARHFNTLVHALPWQHEVERAISDPAARTTLAPAPALTQ